MHQAIRVKFPVFVSIRSKPVPAIVMPLVGEPDRNPIFMDGPKLLDQSIIEFPDPLAGKELNNRFTTRDKLGAITPHAIKRVGP